jgi:ribosomal protein S18
MSGSKDNKDVKAPEKKPEEVEPGIDDEAPIKTLDFEDIALLKRYV